MQSAAPPRGPTDPSSSSSSSSSLERYRRARHRRRDDDDSTWRFVLVADVVGVVATYVGDVNGPTTLARLGSLNTVWHAGVGLGLAEPFVQSGTLDVSSAGRARLQLQVSNRWGMQPIRRIHCGMHGDVAPRLRRSPWLEHVSFRCISTAGLAHVSGGIPQVHTLDLSWCGDGVSTEGLVLVACIQLLHTLNLSWCSGVTTDGLAHVSRIPLLHTLDLSWCKGVTTEGLAHVSCIPLLHTLSLSWCSGLSSEGLAFVGRIPLLHTLDVRGCAGVTTDGLEHISRVPLLHTLDLSSCGGVSTEGLAHVSRIPLLHTLALQYCKGVPREGLAQLLQGMPLLRDLSLNGCTIGVADAADVVALLRLLQLRRG